MAALNKIDLSFNRYAASTKSTIDYNRSATKKLEEKFDKLQKSYDEQLKINRQQLDEQQKANKLAELTAENTKEKVL